MHEASYGNVDLIRLLLASGADVNARDTKGDTPLMYAITGNSPGTWVDVLIKAGADMNAKNKAGASPLSASQRYPWLQAHLKAAGAK